jgi:hypothetical protein
LCFAWGGGGGGAFRTQLRGLPNRGVHRHLCPLLFRADRHTCENRHFCAIYVLKNDDFCQDRLGTNIGITPKKMPLFAPAQNRTNATSHPHSPMQFPAFCIDKSHTHSCMCLLRGIYIYANASESQTGWSPRSERPFER